MNILTLNDLDVLCIIVFLGMTEEYSPVSVNRDVGTEQPSLWIHSSEEPR